MERLVERGDDDVAVVLRNLRFVAGGFGGVAFSADDDDEECGREGPSEGDGEEGAVAADGAAG